jgi:hypothetical protein
MSAEILLAASALAAPQTPVIVVVHVGGHLVGHADWRGGV